VLVLQGMDAGGHQWARGASWAVLVPEVRDMLASEFAGRDVQILAAGGIMDGRGVAGALVLGANGVVMGTRFIATEECPAAPSTKELYVSTTDGAQSTVKSTVMDTIGGTAIWPELYDGRAIINDSFTDYLKGIPNEDNIQKYKEAAEAGNTSRKIVWAGAGVGLVKSIISVSEVVKGSQEEARKILAGASNL